MPAYFESGYFGGRKPAWHGLGVVTDGYLGIDEAIDAGGLRHHISKRTVAVSLTGPDGKNMWVPQKGLKAIVRDTDNRVYRVGSDAFEPVQIEDLANFARGFIGEGALVETAISIHDGARQSLLLQIPKGIKVAGEEVKPYLFIGNAHDGSQQLTVKEVFTRVVCSNTWTAAMGEKSLTWKGRHVGDPMKRLEEAKRIMGYAITRVELFQKTADELLAQTFTFAEYKALCETLIPKPVMNPSESITTYNTKTSNWEKQLDAIVTEWKAPDLGNIIGTKWAAAQAVIAYVDHSGKFRGDNAEKRFIRSIEDATDLKARSFELLTA